MKKLLERTIIFLFFISGISSIVYQIVWQRYLTFSFGSETLSTTIIVSIYMLGLGIGSYLGGLLSDTLNDAKRLRLYVLIELIIALFGVCSNYILYVVLYQSLSTVSLLISVITSFLFLLPPTIAMGSTLPLLSKLFGTTLSKVKLNTYFLYVLNTFGAAFGALIPIVLVLPRFGFEGLIYFAASLNLVCVLVTILIYRQFKEANPASQEPAAAKEPIRSGYANLNWYLLFGVSGFIALSLEMIWFRTLQIMLKGDSFTFPILLAVYLGGIAIGSLVGIAFLNRIQNPANLFFRLQGLIVLYCIFSFVFLYYNLIHTDALGFINRYLYAYDTPSGFQTILIKSALIAFMIFPPTVIMGISFVCLQEASNNSITTFGKNLGTLLFFNIGFSSLSVLITTFLLFEYVGTSLTLIFLALVLVLLFAYKFFYLDTTSRQKLESAVLVGATCIGILLFPGNQSLWQVFQGSHDKKILIAEDKSSISTIKLGFDGSNHDVVFLNGLGQSYFPYSSDYGHLQLGYLPVLIHPNPRKVAIVGFGSGGTLYAASQSEKTEKIDCFEISSNQYSLIQNYHQLVRDQSVSNLFTDTRINLHVQDGRKALLNTRERYDIIEADALRPNSPYSGNIYSVDYFELVKSRLNPDGIAVSWAPTERVKNSFAKVFPYTYTDGFIIIGSKSEIALQLNDEIRNEFKSLPIEWEKSVGNLKKVAYVPEQEINRDLFPRDEFNTKLKEKFTKLVDILKNGNKG